MRIFLAALDILRRVAKKQGLTESERALRWMTHTFDVEEGFDDAVIIGASSTKHLGEKLG